MVKYLYKALLLFAVFSLSSCLHDNNELFDQSAAERLSSTISKEKELLQNAPNGWVFHYFTGEDYTGIGVTHLVKFGKDGKVEAGGELVADLDTTFRSSYDIVASQGPVLTINSLNPVLHNFSEVTIDDVDGDQGDFEFVVLSATPDTVQLKGLKWHNKMLMTRLPENLTWQEYTNQLYSIMKNIPVRYKVKKNGEVLGEMLISKNARHSYVSFADDSEDLEIPYAYTNEGVVLSYPIDKDGSVVNQFLKYDESTATLNAVDQLGNKWEFEGVVGPEYVISVLGSSSIVLGDAAVSTSYRVSMLNKFQFSTTADWLSISKDGNTLTFTAEANETGDARSAWVYITNENGKDSIAITQVDLQKDIVGSYTMKYVQKGVAKTTTATITVDASGNPVLKVLVGMYPQTVKITWDAATATFNLASGQVTGKYSSYSVGVGLVDEDGSYSTSYLTGYNATLYVNAFGTPSITFGGDFLGIPVSGIGFWAYSSAEHSSSNLLGYVMLARDAVLIKNKN